MTLRTPQALRTPRDLAQARARRALVIDVVLAVILAAVALTLAAGLGVIAFFCIPILLVGLLWTGVESLVSRVRSHRRSRRATNFSASR
jgi:diacylglycerol kinase